MRISDVIDVLKRMSDEWQKMSVRQTLLFLVVGEREGELTITGAMRLSGLPSPAAARRAAARLGRWQIRPNPRSDKRSKREGIKGLDLIEAQPNPSNQAERLLYLTPTGKKLFDQLKR
jgi:hypothetical protein